jgi:nitrile hydratase subunit alpha
VTSGHHEPHMKDVEAHVAAVESDLEYFRTKRLEPRVFVLVRRGVLSFDDLLRAAADVPRLTVEKEQPEGEARIRALEERLDSFIRDVACVSLTQLASGRIVIDDVRKERGDYDPYLRIAKRAHEGPLEQRIEQLERQLADSAHLVKVLRHALLATGEVTKERLDDQRRAVEGQGHRNGARIVARAWVDPQFKRRLITTGREAVRELGIPPGRLGRLGVAENTDDFHHVVVCTLCSCYPHDLLGNPPWWYRSDEYKQRIVEDPRGTLRDMFGLDLPLDQQVMVHDSTSDVRWMVLPKRPPGTDGMSEEQLAQLITAESLVGTAEALTPSRSPGRSS